MQNGTDAVTIEGTSGKAQFSGGRSTASLEDAIAQVFRGLTGGQQQIAIPQPRATRINGLDAAWTTARANSGSGAVDVSVLAYRWNPQAVYYFVMLTQAGQGIGPFTSMVNSLRRISPAEAAAIRPRVIDVVTVKPGQSVASLAARMAYANFREERFRSLNGLAPDARLVPGQRVKLVVYG
jgi:predicted Zn-dependent protease